MSTEKLSELSKPVAQIYYDELDSSVMRIGWFRSDEPKNPEHLYSQEYVSALLAELEAKDERIGELEAKLATPVRLPGSFYPDGDIDLPLVVELDEAVEAIRAAGFTGEGDE